MILIPIKKEPEIIFREYKKFSGPLTSKIAMLTLNRITKLGLIFMAMLEIPKIINETKKGNYKQIPAAFVNIISFAFFGALLSSIGTYTFGVAGSVLGLGLGYYAGGTVSKYFNSKY